MIKKIKKDLGLTSIELSKFLGVTPPTLRNWERNDTWPLWALRKCNAINNKDELIVERIRGLLDED